MNQLTHPLHKIIVAICLSITPLLVSAQQENINVSIDVSETGPAIDELLYGHFIENLSNWFEGGLWAEMLGDRKFFYPINNADTLIPQNSRSWILGRWRPVGPESVIDYETSKPFTGKQSPKIAVSSGTAHGIKQSGLVLEAGKTYEGRVVLASTVSDNNRSHARARVSLKWGTKASDAAIIELDSLTSSYETYYFSFTPAADTENGTLEITGTGTGYLTIGAVSLMPGDNINGFRPDLVKLLKEMRVTMFRWGGNFSAGYEWRDGIGDRDKRPPKYDYAWEAVEQNDVGTFEFLRLCELTNSLPNIGVNAGLGDAYSAGQWVEYVNGDQQTTMGELRAKHGHPEPFNVKWWGIGNEMYGKWQLGHLALEYYVIKHNQFAERMRAADPDIILVASGASINEMSMTARHWPKPLPGPLPFEYGSPQDWSGGLIEHSAENFDYLAEHFYPSPTYAFDLERQELVERDDPRIVRVRRGANRVKTAVEAWAEYNKRFPWLKQTDIKMVLDEWVSGVRGFEGALGVAISLNEIYRHTDIFKMSAYTCGPCALTYNETSVAYRGIGLVFKLYANEFGTIPVKVQGTTPWPEIAGTIGVDRPKESSGSSTYPLDVMAAVSADGSVLTLSVVNASETTQEMNLSVEGSNPGNVKHYEISSSDQTGGNVAGEEMPVQLNQRDDFNFEPTFRISPGTINLYKINLD